MPHWFSLTIVGALVLGCGGEAGDGVLVPDVVAASKYIDYGTWADTTSVCMDDRLARWDRYIEETSAFLGIDPPARRISYVWAPKSAWNDDTWPCSEGLAGCAHDDNAGYQSVAYASRPEMLHELAHSVEIPALGTSHRVFREGMAEYLSESISTGGATGEFPAAFAEMLEPDRLTSRGYQLAMHFVGSLIERDGLEKYLEYRALVPVDGDLVDFARAHEQVYGHDLSGALAAMDMVDVVGRGPKVCDEELVGERIVLDGSTELRLAGECGDGDFYSAGGVPGRRPPRSPSGSTWPFLGITSLRCEARDPRRRHTGSRS